MKRYFGIIGLCLAMFILGFIFSDLISLPTKDGQIGESLGETADDLFTMEDTIEETADDLFTMEDTIEAVVTETDDLNDTTDTEQETVFEQTESPELLRDSKGLDNRMFYLYSTSGYAKDSEVSNFIEWDMVCSEDKEHNEWIDQQTFNSVFRNESWCIRTGYYRESGQWTVTIFTYYGFNQETFSVFHTSRDNLSYDMDPYQDFSPRYFGVPDDYSVEITSFDESKQTVTLIFTSPEGGTTEIYINYEKRCRCDEDGTPLLDENGNTFLYQFD